jgi:hypothetical protein
MVAVHNFEVMSGKSNIIQICSNGIMHTSLYIALYLQNWAAQYLINRETVQGITNMSSDRKGVCDQHQQK